MKDSMPPGWYAGEDGKKNYWTGEAWAPGPDVPAPVSAAEPVPEVSPAPASEPSPLARMLGRSRGERIGFAVALVFIVAIVIAVWRPWGSSSSPSPAFSPAGLAPVVQDETPRIRYELDGDGVTQADITISTPSGTSQQQGIDVPMRNKAGDPGLTFQFSSGSFVYISAQIQEGSGSLTCRIVSASSGVVISENRASGDYAIATCNGRAR